jgi:hypothetical protein
MIPLPASAVNQIVKAVEPFEFDRIYGAWWGKIVLQDAKNAVSRSAARYVRAIQRYGKEQPSERNTIVTPLT